MNAARQACNGAVCSDEMRKCRRCRWLRCSRYATSDGCRQPCRQHDTPRSGQVVAQGLLSTCTAGCLDNKRGPFSICRSLLPSQASVLVDAPSAARCRAVPLLVPAAVPPQTLHVELRKQPVRLLVARLDRLLLAAKVDRASIRRRRIIGVWRCNGRRRRPW